MHISGGGLKKGGMEFQSPSVQSECGNLCFAYRESVLEARSIPDQCAAIAKGCFGRSRCFGFAPDARRRAVCFWMRYATH